MAVRDFAIDLIDELLKDKELALTDQDIRFYDKGSTAETDEDLDDHIRWKNVRYFNEESNVVRSSLLIIQLSFENGSEHVSFHMGGALLDLPQKRHEGGPAYRKTRHQGFEVQCGAKSCVDQQIF